MNPQPLLRFIRRIPARDLQIMGLLSAASGLATTALLIVVNAVAEAVADGAHPDWSAAIGFLAAFGVFLTCNRAALLRANTVIESQLREVRLEIVERIRRSELKTIEDLDRGELYTLISQETNHLSMVFPVLVDCVAQAAVLGASLAYITVLSPAAAALFVAVTAVGIVIYLRNGERLMATLWEVNERQARMLDRIGDIVEGAVELRLSAARSDGVFEAFKVASAEAERWTSRFGERWVAIVMMTSFLTYYMLGVVVFLFPTFVTGHNHIILALTPALLLAMGPLFKFVGAVPLILRANVGVSGLEAALARLEAAGGVAPAEARALSAQFQGFQEIRFEGLQTSYRDATGRVTFTAGPLHVNLRRGEILFLVGGNGAGKSTSLRMMTGLYPHEAGRICIDGAPVEGAALAGMRELYSAIFTDFHLFDRLYGLRGVDPARVTELIETMRLSHKVRYVDGRFSDIKLSTGQKKRLALITTLLEDRPITVFDEWPAEQDQEFREFFYFSILPMIKARGGTVLAVTHDDRYWHVADRVIRLDLGAVAWEKAGGELVPDPMGN